MKKISLYLDEAIESGVAKNSSDLARLLGISRSALSEWRADRSSPNDDQAVKLAELLGKDPGELLAECGAARAKTPETRRAWERIAARMAASAAVVAVLVALGAPDEVYANVITGPDVTVFRSSLLVLLQWLVIRHPSYDGAHKTLALCIQLISSRLFRAWSALLGQRAYMA